MKDTNLERDLNILIKRAEENALLEYYLQLIKEHSINKLKNIGSRRNYE